MIVLQFGRGLRRSGAMALALCMVAFVAAPVLAGPIGAVGDLYVGDGDIGGIFQYDGVTGAPVAKFASRGARTFMQHAWGADGNLYAVDNASPSSWSVDQFDGNTGVRIKTIVNYNVPGVPSVGKGLAFGPDGDMYVGDWYNARIDRYKGTTGSLKASYQGVSGDNLGTPNYMTFAPNGHLMVVSGGWNRVLQFDTSGVGLSLLGTFATISDASQPQDLAFGPNGNLFVTSGLGAVKEFDGTTGAFVRDLIPNSSDPNSWSICLRFDSHDRLLTSTVNPWRVAAYDALTGSPLGDFIPEGSGGISSPIYMSIKPTPEPATAGLLLVAGLALSLRRGRGA